MADQIYKVRDPSGAIREISGPAGATDEQIISQAQLLFSAKESPAVDKSELIKRELTSPFRTLANVVGSVVEPAIQMGTGFLAKPISEIAGMAAAGRELISPIGGDPEAFKKDIANRLTYAPRTAGGKFVSEEILAPIGSVIGAGANKIGEGIKAVTGSDIAASGGQEAAMQAVGFLGVKGAPKVAGSIREASIAKADALSQQKALDAIRNKTRADGQSIGLIAPAEGAFKEGLSKMGGAEPHISLKNTQTSTNAIAKDVGLGKGAISDTDIASRVKALSKDYEIVTKALGDNVPLNKVFTDDVSAVLGPMKEKYLQDPKTFAALERPIELLEQQLKPIVDSSGALVKQEISSSIVMSKIRQLRSDARKFDKDTTGDPSKMAMAEANYKLANMYENLMEGVLSDSGKTALLDKFRDSRKQLAQIHLLDAARMPDGLIDMQRLSSLVGRYGADKKMVSGNIQIVSDFANTFKNVSKPISADRFATPSRWETVGAIGGIAGAPTTGGASLLFAAPMAARTITPSLAVRGMLQGKPSSYELWKARQLAPGAAQAGMLGAAFSPYLVEEQPPPSSLFNRK